MHPIAKYHFIQQLQALPCVHTIYLFGSRARGDNNPRSDIDLAIDCPQATEAQWQEILDLIADADTLLKIDCIRLDKLYDESLLAEIKQHNKILYHKEEIS